MKLYHFNLRPKKVFEENSLSILDYTTIVAMISMVVISLMLFISSCTRKTAPNPTPKFYVDSYCDTAGYDSYRKKNEYIMQLFWNSNVTLGQAKLLLDLNADKYFNKKK